MALFQKDDKTSRPLEEPRFTPPPPSLPPLPSYDSSSTPEFQASLGVGSRVEGRLSFEGSVKVDGHIDGEINAQDTIIIGENATVSAQLQANTVIVHGRVTGDITARKRVELRSPARLIGNISTPSLVINEGVTFEGHCTMGTAEKEKSDKKVAIFPKEGRASSDVAG